MNKQIAIAIAADNRMFGSQPKESNITVRQCGAAYAELSVWEQDTHATCRSGYNMRISRFEMDKYDREQFDAAYGQ